ncbi:MAG: GerMN domain-containing protein [Spirochaetes bacterium]|nr:GerMN domain-containing protein [Spirochaetota bacterium]
MAKKKKNNRSGKKTNTRVSKKRTAISRKKPTPHVSQHPPETHSPKRSAVYLLIILAMLTAFAIILTRHFTDKWQRQKETKKNALLNQKESTFVKVSHSDIDQGQQPKKEKMTDAQKKENLSVPESKIKIYFLRFDEKSEQISLVPTLRNIKGEASLEKAIAELVKGPNKIEKEKGMLTAIPPHVKLRGVSVKGNIAEIDFNDAIEKNAAGNILLNRLDQIVYTATEIEGINSVIIKINGKHKQTFGSDGLSIGGPLHRRK